MNINVATWGRLMKRAEHKPSTRSQAPRSPEPRSPTLQRPTSPAVDSEAKKYD